MQIPRDETLSEALYRDIEKNEYLNEIYDALRTNYSIRLFGYNRPLKEINVKDAVRFADLLAKSTHKENAERHHLWGQEIAILLNLLYPENEIIKYYLGSVLSSLGNYRALQSETINDFKSIDMFDSIYYDFDRDNHQIPGKEKEYFFSDQKIVYDGLGGKCFSYSGPTSMGKSFVVQTYIEECIKHGSEENYAILVPTKALINEVRSSFLNSLQGEMAKDRDYRVIVSSGDYLLKQEHHFIFVMTPERFLHLLIDKPKIPIHFLFIDEAHKISYKGGRSTYYYKVIAKLYESGKDPNIIFASPSIPNPEVFINLIPNGHRKEFKKLASKYSPVCQLKYLLNTHDKTVSAYNEYTKTSIPLDYMFTDDSLPGIVSQVGRGKQNLVYCSSKTKVLEYANRYVQNLMPSTDEHLIRLAEAVKREVHSNCYLADFIKMGVAYHVGYLPASIRLSIEKAFKDGYLRTIFCTSTLIEGVNLPADNLFITSYRNGQPNMTPVEFRNLVGRVGRIRYNLYGNVFLIRDNEKVKEARYEEYLKNDIPPQIVSLDAPDTKAHYEDIVEDLVEGEVELPKCQEANPGNYEGLRKFALILARDIALDQDTPVRRAFLDSEALNEEKEKLIKQNFPVEKTDDDITMSYDQSESLHDAIVNGLEYPLLSGENDDVDFEEVVRFMMRLRKIFKWDVYEKETIGREGTNRIDSVIRWYSQILLRWIRGNGLNQIISSSLRFKANHPNTGVWVGGVKYADYYNKDSKLHQNYVIADTLGVIENVLLFSISNYFRKVSLEYKEYHQCEYFENDWYEYVEYGTTSPVTIFLQQTGFTRETASYIQANQHKYLTFIDGEYKVKKSIMECGNDTVETDAHDLQFNIPELFVD
ncbi:MAG: DEAD/DEAH box helicase [Lachnospiraceae bacterium]|nr:DEAD/DEAH box helicase [Lachnospiraceae bacterium]